MALSGSNTAAAVNEDALVEEPSMEEILASIKQIIADDEAPDDGLSERERYTHPSDHSNSNELEDTLEADLQAGMEAEIQAAIGNEESPETEEIPHSADTLTATSAATALKAAMTVEERAAQIRREITSEAAGLTSDQRLEKYRLRGKLQMETLAEERAKAEIPPAPVADPIAVSPAVAAGPVLPTTNAIAQEMAATMMSEKSDEIQSMVAELMRPTIRQWLSDNLPSMVEKLVREEIERVSRGKQAS